MLLAVSAFTLNNSVLFYLVIYVSMTLGVFACIMGIENNGKPVTELQDLSGLAKTDPLIAGALAIFMFSLAGIPPFAGFFAKFYVFQAAIKAELYLTIMVAVIAVIISAYYYLKILNDALKNGVI